MPGSADTVLLPASPVPESALTAALTGSYSLVTLKHETPGPTIRVRILRACGDWIEGDEPEVHADYGRGLIANGLADDLKA